MNFEKLERMLLDKVPVNNEKKQVLQRRLNKLKRDPMGFIEGSYAKRKDQARKYLPIKHNGTYQYTVVSAVYNVEKYLDEYFDSLINQSLNFKNHIQLILVDDGSTDNSADIIKRWQKKYPNNIHYYYKENGGISSARNFGLQYVQTGWVTFIDPDDFVNSDYFKNIDDILVADSSIKMLVANTHFYIESTNQTKDNHPLRFRFHQKDKKYSVKALGNNINLSAAATIFAYDVIQKNVLAFDQRVKPNFEDGKFIGEFLLNAQGGFAWFADNVIYNYRKRDDGTSTLDGSWNKIEKFSKVLEYGFLDLLHNYKKHLGYVPENIQMTAMYDMYWYLVHLLNQSEKIDFLTEEERINYHNLYRQVMEYIDAETITKFGIAGAWFFHKVGFLGAFKGEKPPFQICYIESVDHDKQQILISYFDYFDLPVSYKVNGADTQPKYQKTVRNEFNGELFTYEKRAWVAVDDLQSELVIEIDGKPARLALKNHKHIFKYKAQDIFNAFKSTKYVSDGSWLLMDRETKADDNAEHLYRYLMQNHPEQKCYFALNRDAADWERLSAEGFDLVAFGEPVFETRLAKSEKIISSHIEAHIHNYFGDLYEGTKKFVFLQHGVTQNNLSRWLNGKRHVACLITTNMNEYQSIAVNSKYKFMDKEVVLTGFPRHDSLYHKQKNGQTQKTILIMPTWRSYLMGATVGKGANTRSLNPKLLESDYAQHWLSLLKSERLKQMTEQYGYQVVFAPHANIEPYLDQMQIPDYIQVWQASKSETSMQDLFVEAGLLVTDYSSVAFEMAYIGKPTLYYQFDKDEFFSGTHSYQKGYFEYEEYGFGPVAYQEVELLNELQIVLDGHLDEKYVYRINHTFEYQDDGNCERVYQAIKALDNPDDSMANIPLLQNALRTAIDHQAWELVAERAETLIAYDSANIQYYQTVLMEALIALGQWQKAQSWIDGHPAGHTQEHLFKMAYANRDWQKVYELYANMEPAFEVTYAYLQALLHLSKIDDARILLGNLMKNAETDEYRLAVNLWRLDFEGDYSGIIEYVDEVTAMDFQSLKDLKIQLLLAKAYRKLGMYDEAHTQLVGFKKHTGGDIDCRIEIAKLAFARTNYKKCLDQYEKLINSNYQLSEMQNYQYIKSLYFVQDYTKFIELFHESNQEIEDLPVLYIKSLIATKQWQQALDTMEREELNACDELCYERVLANYRLGMIERAYQYANKPTPLDTYEYWELIAELAFLMEDRDLEKYCYRGMVAVFPDVNKEKNLLKLQQIQH